MRVWNNKISLMHGWRKWKFENNLGIYDKFEDAFPMNQLFSVRDSLTHVHKETGTQIFTTALFVIETNCKQLECPSVEGWINKLHSAHLCKSCINMEEFHKISYSEYRTLFYKTGKTTTYEVKTYMGR